MGCHGFLPKDFVCCDNRVSRTGCKAALNGKVQHGNENVIQAKSSGTGRVMLHSGEEKKWFLGICLNQDR